MAADLIIHIVLLASVVGLPWAFLSYGLRNDIRALMPHDEEIPARHAALMSRYRHQDGF